MSGFKSVSLPDIQRAFVTAHRASENPQHSKNARSVFRLIAKQIWEACPGERQPFPTGSQLDEAIARGAEPFSVQRETENPK